MDARIKKLRNLVDLLLDKWLLLDARAELLRPALTNNELVQRFNKSRGARGFDLARLSLAELCLIQASGLLTSPEDSDASLSSLIEALRKKNHPVYEALKKDFCQPDRINIIDRRERLDPEVVRALEEQHKKEDTEKKSRQFKKVATEIVTRYDHLMKKGLGKKIKTIRDKVLAHFGTRHDGTKRVLSSTADYELIANDVFEIVDEIGGLCKKCVLVICNAGWCFADIRQSHKEEARTYWEVATSMGEEK